MGAAHRSPDSEIADPQLADFAERLRRQREKHTERGEIDSVLSAMASYAHWQREEFGAKHDDFRLIGQDNFRRYLPVGRLTIRVHPDDSLFELFARAAAAKAAGCRTTVSYPHEHPPHVSLLDKLTESWAGAIEFLEESDEELAEAIRTRQTDRVRYAAPDRAADLIRRIAPEVELYIADAPVLAHGRIELLWYVQEQSLCVNYHRYGNLGARADEPRAETV